MFGRQEQLLPSIAEHQLPLQQNMGDYTFFTPQYLHNIKVGKIKENQKGIFGQLSPLLTEKYKSNKNLLNCLPSLFRRFELSQFI